MERNDVSGVILPCFNFSNKRGCVSTCKFTFSTILVLGIFVRIFVVVSRKQYMERRYFCQQVGIKCQSGTNLLLLGSKKSFSVVDIVQHYVVV